MKRMLACIATLSMFVASTPAEGQIWIGEVAGRAVREAVEFEAMCRIGGARDRTSEGELARMRVGAQATMTAYLELARSADPADVSAVFVRREPAWTRVSESASADDVHAVRDPFAAHVAELELPTQFIRAADGRSIAGLWRVTSSVGAPAGYYRGVFRRFGYAWRLVSLDVSEGETPPSLNPYCHTFGDVDAYQAEQLATVVVKDEAASQESAAPEMDGLTRLPAVEPSAQPGN